MGTGFLEVVTSTGFGALPVPHAQITVSQNGNVLHEFQTDESGIGNSITLDAPDIGLTLDYDFMGVPYGLYDVKAEAPGFTPAVRHGLEILDTETSILPISMVPLVEEGQVSDLEIGYHNLTSTEGRSMERPGPFMPRVLSEVIIPEFITVHLGRPDRPARNVRVPFPYYIKNVCSHEIYATWPPASLEANIYCQISLTLNRIFTEWYRVRGHSFDITNSTQFDQMFVEGGQIFRTIDAMVDRIINRFIRREGHLEPFFAEYCDGRRSTCPGLWQWSTVTLANQGRNALQILRNFYPNDVQIVETDNIGWVSESFPGYALRPGMSGPAVRTVQNWLNRIRVNFPIIPPITNVSGVYGPQTEAAVRAFQSIRELGMMTPNGIVDRNTWLRMSFTLSAVQRLGELTSEGIIMGIGRTPPTDIIREGARGRLVAQAQYIMNFIAQFYPAVPMVTQNSSFTRDFANAVREFQRAFGLNADGVIGPNTWRMLYSVYWRIRDNVSLPPWEGGEVPPLPPGPPTPPPPPPGGIPPYPGQLIRVGSRGADVERIQRCLNSVRQQNPSIGQLTVDGIFGPITQASVMAFQRIANLNPDGIVGPLTWNALMPRCYGRPMPPYPGYLMRVGVRGENVRQVQSCLNTVNNAGLATDGVFGPLTQAAVINYQRANGLNPDGIVGPITWDHLMRRCGFTPAGVTAREGVLGESLEVLPELPPSEGIAWNGNPPGTPLPEGYGGDCACEENKWMPPEEIMPEEGPMFTMAAHPVMPLPVPIEPAQPVEPIVPILPIVPIVPIEPMPLPAPVPLEEPPSMPPQITINPTLNTGFELNWGGLNLPDIDLDELLKMYLLSKMRK
ncbi:MAG: peptidoglycan-binding protein [Defluviitaleaceae bacterium]|nr:peptidoglycan-binding protein [Defluviitaleaceae bacterium]